MSTGHTVELGRMFSNAGGALFGLLRLCAPCVTSWSCTSLCRGLYLVRWRLVGVTNHHGQRRMGPGEIPVHRGVGKADKKSNHQRELLSSTLRLRTSPVMLPLWITTRGEDKPWPPTWEMTALVSIELSDCRPPRPVGHEAEAHVVWPLRVKHQD